MQNKILLAIMIASLLIGACTLTRGHDWGDDFASYIMQAEAFLNGNMGEFVEDNTFTIFESSILIGPVAYPWGYPLILAPVFALKGNSPIALKLPGLFFFALFLLCLFLTTKDRLTRTESLLLVSLFAFNPMLLKFLNQILSDIPFLFFSTLALLFITNGNKRGVLPYVLLGATIFSAFFIRTTGILLLASFLILEFIRAWNNRTDRASVIEILRNTAFASGTFSLLWIASAMLFPGGVESYIAQYQDFRIETGIGFINDYFQVFSLFFGTASAWKYLYYVLFLFFILGLWERRKDELIFILFSAIWMIALIAWPSWQGPRFVFPLYPVFIYFTFQGMKAFINKLAVRYRSVGQSVFRVLWLSIIAVFLFTSITSAYANLQNGRTVNGPFDPISMEVYDYIKEKTPSDSIVVFFKPRAMRLFTDRDSLMSIECDRLSLGDFVVLSKKAENSQIPPEKIESCNLPLDDVFENRRFIVYKILK